MKRFSPFLLILFAIILCTGAALPLKSNDARKASFSKESGSIFRHINEWPP